MKAISKIVILLIVLMLVEPVLLYTVKGEEDAPNIMVIHSYDLSYQWTNKQDEGLRNTILEDYPKANIYTEVLDAKRISKDYILSEQKDFFVEKYSEVDLDLILATDDLGLAFAVEVREALDLDIPIAFSGVLESMVDTLIDGAEDVTGVYEIRGFTRMIELMRRLQPDATKVVIINDLSSSSQQMVQKVNSFEALLRWKSSCYGPVSPSVFIHVAETSGQILTLGDKVIDMAIEFVKKLQNKKMEFGKVSINVSVVQFYEPDFVSSLISKLKENEIDYTSIQLEIVESMMIHSYEIIYSKLEELKVYGITVALDDFGTGYSSLSHIDKLPIDVVKIDKQFVDDILESKDNNLVIDSICALTKSLSLKTIAEGVETLEQVEYVKNCGCDFIQGYYYSKPLEENDAIAFLEEHK